jgi:penicillin V acylase-like amidase (Ntn superfamily)
MSPRLLSSRILLNGAACAVLLLGALFGPASACSLFSLASGDTTVYGRNLDWSAPLPGAVIVNPRGIEKSVLPWRGRWPAPHDGPRVSWTARFGSVTFTCYGRDFIEGGMNEAGLIVSEASLEAVYPPPDGRPGVSCAQWMQYQLDNYATVEEVLLHIGDLRPDGEGWHYLLADAAGECAVIEYESGHPVIYTRDGIDVCALTNTTYARALSHVRMDLAFGGDADIATSGDSYGRFVTMANLMRNYDPAVNGALTGQAFRILDEVRVEDTLRSTVYDAARSRVSWKTRGNPDVRRLDLSTLDLGEGAPVRMMDVEAGEPGDAGAMLSDYSDSANRAIVSWVRAAERDGETDEELASRGLTFEEALEMIAAHPGRNSQ